MDIVNTLVQGTLLGGMFALYAVGLSLVFGVMRIVNIAHGDLIVLMAYCALVVVEALGINPLVAIPFVVVLSALLGWVMQAGLFEFVPRKDPLIPLIVAFGLSIIIQNVLLVGFGADPQKLTAGPIELWSLDLLPGVRIGVMPLLIFALAVLLILVLQWIIYRTAFGRALRAVSDNEQNASSIGVDTRKVFRLAFVIVMITVAMAGVMMGLRSNFDPAAGSPRLLSAFEAVVIGGLGNLWGTLAGGVILGIAQMIGAQIDASWQVIAGHVTFLVILVLRPSGLFPKNSG